MKAKAKARFIRIAPRKVRLVADMVRGKNVKDSMNLLRFTPKKAAALLSRVLHSAMANAMNRDESVDAEDLYIHTIMVDEGPTLRRFRARAMGRATRILKRTSHITVILESR